MVCFVNIAGIDPEVLQAILLGLFFTKLDLLVAILILAYALCQVFECDLLVVGPLCVREYCIVWDYIVAGELLSEVELASFIM
jgi:hypothetical protein